MNEFFRQISGGAAPKKHGQEGPGRTHQDIHSAVHNDLRHLVGQSKYEKIKTHSDIERVIHAIVPFVAGNDRDGWKFHGMEGRQNIKDRIKADLMKMGLPEKGAIELRDRITKIVWHDWK